MPTEIEATISLKIIQPPSHIANALYQMNGPPSEVAQKMEQLAAVLRTCNGIPQAITEALVEPLPVQQTIEASSLLALIATALNMYPNSTNRFIPIDTTTLSRIAEYVSPNQDKSVPISVRRRSALEALRQEGVYSFNEIPDELQGLANYIQQRIRGLTPEQYAKLADIIAPQLGSAKR